MIAFTKKILHQKFIPDIFLYNYIGNIVFLTFLTGKKLFIEYILDFLVYSQYAEL